MKLTISSFGWLLIQGAVVGGAIYLFIYSPTTAHLSIELMKVIVSWPAAVASLGLSFGFAFKEQIARKIEEVDSFTGPNGIGFSSRQSADSEQTATLNSNDIQLEETVAHLRSLVQSQEEDRQRFIDEAIDIIKGKDAEALGWRFQYLSLFLVRKTIAALHWIREAGPMSAQFFNQYWAEIEPDEEQRRTILGVLAGHGLVEEVDELLSATEVGRQFLNFVGVPGSTFDLP